MYPHITVFSAATIASTLRMYRNIVQWSEMAPYATNFLLENFVEEACFEFTLAGTGGSNVHSSLTTSEDDVVLFRGDGSAIEWRISLVCFEDDEIGCRDELYYIINISICFM